MKRVLTEEQKELILQNNSHHLETISKIPHNLRQLCYDFLVEQINLCLSVDPAHVQVLCMMHDFKTSTKIACN